MLLFTFFLNWMLNRGVTTCDVFCAAPCIKLKYMTIKITTNTDIKLTVYWLTQNTEIAD